MSERPGDSGGMTSGDPLGGGDAPMPRRTSPACPATRLPRRPAPAGRWRRPSGSSRRRSAGSSCWRAGGRASARTLIDGLIVGVGALILFLPLVAAGLTRRQRRRLGPRSSAPGIVWVFCLAIVALLYAPVMMARTNGRTLGRMATDIRVVRASGEPITFGFAVLREVVVKCVPLRHRRRAHRRDRAAARRPVAAVGRAEPLPARLHRRHAGGAGLAARRAATRRPAAVARPASVQMTCSRPGPTPTSAIGTPTKSAMKAR